MRRLSRHPETAGGLWRRPEGQARFVPLRLWPKGRLTAELSRVDCRLAELALGGPGARVEAKTLRKYRNRLARALA